MVSNWCWKKGISASRFKETLALAPPSPTNHPQHLKQPAFLVTNILDHIEMMPVRAFNEKRFRHASRYSKFAALPLEFIRFQPANTHGNLHTLKRAARLRSGPDAPRLGIPQAQLRLHINARLYERFQLEDAGNRHRATKNLLRQPEFPPIGE